MIIKNYEITKINFEKNKFFLLYGDNEGFKNEIIDNITKNKNIAWATIITCMGYLL